MWLCMDHSKEAGEATRDECYWTLGGSLENKGGVHARDAGGVGGSIETIHTYIMHAEVRMCLI